MLNEVDMRMMLDERALLPDALLALPASSLRVVLQRWVVRALRCWVRECLYVAHFTTAAELLQSLPRDDVIELDQLSWLLDEAEDACSFDGEAVKFRCGTQAVTTAYPDGVNDDVVRLAQRALSATISDVQFLSATLDERDAVRLLDSARATVSMGLVQLQVAHDLLSPAVVAVEQRRRAADVVTALRGPPPAR